MLHNIFLLAGRYFFGTVNSPAAKRSQLDYNSIIYHIAMHVICVDHDIVFCKTHIFNPPCTWLE